MSYIFKNSFFGLLPNEILIRILKLVDGSTLIIFCDLYKLQYFLQDKDIVRDLDISKDYRIVDLDYLKNISFDLITCLNINCIYWIPAYKWRRFLVKLVNLEELYAIQTQLSLNRQDVEMYNKLKIKKLGVSVLNVDSVLNTCLHHIQTIYLQFLTTRTFECSKDLLQNANKIWYDMETFRQPPFLCGAKDKIFCQYYTPKALIGRSAYIVLCRHCSYNFRDPRHPYIICVEKDGTESNALSLDLEQSEPWNILNSRGIKISYSYYDSKKLQNENFNTIRFEELFFKHIFAFCGDRSRQAFKDILRMDCSKKLKKLCINICLMQNDEAPSVANESETTCFSRKRVGLDTNSSSHSISSIFENFSNLEELEIFNCDKVSHTSVIPAFGFITIFKNLKRLQIEVPVTLDGSFLVSVFEKCGELEIVEITSHVQNEKLNYNMCKALPFARKLKDFRYQTKRMSLDKVLDQLSIIKPKSLQRVALISDKINVLSKSSIKKFLEAHPSLIFFYIAVKDLTLTSIKTIRDILNNYKKTHPAKVFSIQKEIPDEVEDSLIPAVHFIEMLRFETALLKLNAVTHFKRF